MTIIAVGIEKDLHRLDCARNDDFRMTETDNYASKACSIGEVDRFCNFGRWDDPDYSDCCMCLSQQ